MQSDGDSVEALGMQQEWKDVTRVRIERGRPKEQECLFGVRYSVEILARTFSSPQKIVKILSEMCKSQPGQVDFGSFLKEVRKFLEDPKNIKELNYKLERKQPAAIFTQIQRIFIKHFLCLFSYLWREIGLPSLLHTLTHKKHNVIVRLQDKQDLLAFQIHLKSSSWTLESPSSSLNLDARGSHSQRQEGTKGQHQKEEVNNFKDYLNRLLVSGGNIKILPKQQHTFLLLYKTQKLGEGGFGVVMLAESVTYSEGKCVEQEWAVKQLKKHGRQQRQSSINIDREYHMLTKLKKLPSFRSNKISRNIIDIGGLIEDNNKRYIMFQYCPFKDLSRFMHPSNSQCFQKINKKHIFIIIYNLISTLYFIHYELIKKPYDYQMLNGLTEDKLDREELGEKHIRVEGQTGIIHRDIKPGNIMVKHFGPHWIMIKLIDWAFSKGTLTEQRINSLRCGTQSYQAPEFDRKGDKYCCKIDVWALGVTIYFLVAGKGLTNKQERNRSGDYKKNFKDKIAKMQLNPSRKFSEAEQNLYKKILFNCFEEQPERRWSSAQLYKFIEENKLYRPISPADLEKFYKLKALRVKFTQAVNEVRDSSCKKAVHSAILAIAVTFSQIYRELVEELMDQCFIEDHQLYKGFWEDLEQQKNIFSNDSSKECYRGSTQRNRPQMVESYFLKCYKTCEIIQKIASQEAVVRLKYTLRQLEDRWKEKQKSKRKFSS